MMRSLFLLGRCGWVGLVSVCVAGLVWLGGLSVRGGVGSPGELLPESTLAFLSVPDVEVARGVLERDSMVRLFGDPAMEEYAGRVRAAWEEGVLGFLKGFLGVDVVEFFGLLEGQLTLGLFVEMDDGEKDFGWDFLVLADSGERVEDLKGWLFEAGEALAGRGLEGVEVGGRPFFRFRVGEDGDGDWLYFGRVGSLLLVSSGEDVVGGVLPLVLGEGGDALADSEAFGGMWESRFKNSWGYGWVNFERAFELLMAQAAVMDGRGEGREGLSLMTPRVSDVLQGLGLGGLDGLSVNVRDLEGGGLVELGMVVPEGEREGIFGLLDWEAKDCLPLAWVSGDVVSFSRTRVDLRELWDGLEEMVVEQAPMVFGLVEMFLGQLGKEVDVGFDFRESFVGNLGDDVVTVSFLPEGLEGVELDGLEDLEGLMSLPQLFLLGSGDAEELARSIVVAGGLRGSKDGEDGEDGGGEDGGEEKEVFGFSEREFMGRTIYSFEVGGLPGAMVGVPGLDLGSVGFFMAASGGYLAFSMEEGLVEGFLREDVPVDGGLGGMDGLGEAVGMLGEGLSSFRFDNPTEWIGLMWEGLRREGDLLEDFDFFDFFLGGMEMDWGLLDFSVLPPFEEVREYFYFGVAGSSSDAEVMSYRLFFPLPPGLR